RRRLVLAQIAGLEPRNNDMCEAGGGDRVEIGARQYTALFQHGCAELQAMRKDRPFRLGCRNFAELHAAAPGCNGIVRPSRRPRASPGSLLRMRDTVEG